jgi:hypothetical protein
MPWLEDISSLLTGAGVGVLNTNIFLGTSSNIPAGVGPYLLIKETAGMAPERLHTNSSGQLNAAAYERPGAQITVRSTVYINARDMARAAFTALDGNYNTTINSCWYREILAQQRPFDMGPDDTKRVRVGFNILGVKALS